MSESKPLTRDASRSHLRAAAEAHNLWQTATTSTFIANQQREQELSLEESKAINLDRIADSLEQLVDILGVLRDRVI